MNEKKRRAVIFVAAAAALAVVLTTSFSRNDLLIRDDTGSYFRARTIFVAGGLVLCSRERPGFATRADALRGPAADSGISLISLKHVQLIEFIGGPDAEGPGLAGWNPSLKDLIGDYNMNAAGNRGYLALRTYGGAVYGTVRFPEWGRGATEYLKNLTIANGRISFVRSATTKQELSRLGAASPFIQVYSGEYLRSGGFIRGVYTVQGQSKSWDAVRIR